MVVNGWRIILKSSFLKQLRATRDYIANRYDRQTAKELVADCIKYIHEQIPRNPGSFTLYKWRRDTSKQIRRAVFRKKYYIVFNVLPGKIQVLPFFYARRDPKNIQI